FSEAPVLLGERYHLPPGSFITEDVLFVNGASFEDGTAYSLETGELVDSSAVTRRQFDTVARLMALSDAYEALLPADADLP
ncbi:MAG: hypothetical protein OEV43_06995, partial [Coriobacteriia bacterium]|nr:hypothetical protein [Coriobacteriia bacterium]